MSNIVGRPRIISLDKGYIIRVAFSWQTLNVGAALNYPELFAPNTAGNFTNGVSENFDASSYQNNVALPSIKTVRGVINFNNNRNGYTSLSDLGPLVLTAPDTQDVLVIRPDINPTDGTNHVAGNPTQYTRTFQLPIYTAGTLINVLKVADLNPLQTNGMLVLELMTFDAPVIY